MEKLPQHLAFLTVKEGEVQLQRLKELYLSLSGRLYRGIVADQLIQLHDRLDELRKQEKQRGVSVSHILDAHYKSTATERKEVTHYAHVYHHSATR